MPVEHFASSCPRCRARLATPIYCWRCGAWLELQPAFLATWKSRVLFFAGAVLLGRVLSATLGAPDFTADGSERLLVDSGLGIGYYLAARCVFRLFQHPAVVAMPERGADGLAPEKSRPAGD